MTFLSTCKSAKRPAGRLGGRRAPALQARSMMLRGPDCPAESQEASLDSGSNDKLGIRHDAQSRPVPRGPVEQRRGRLARRTGEGLGKWSRTGSNRRPPACKAGALPTELRPQWREKEARGRRPGAPASPDVRPLTSELSREVGAPRLELGTSALSGLRSNQLSYAPAAATMASAIDFASDASADGAPYSRSPRGGVKGGNPPPAAVVRSDAIWPANGLAPGGLRRL